MLEKEYTYTIKDEQGTVHLANFDLRVNKAKCGKRINTRKRPLRRFNTVSCQECKVTKQNDTV